MFCTNCGKKLLDMANVCPYCGAKRIAIQNLNNVNGGNAPREYRPNRTNKNSTWWSTLLEVIGWVGGTAILIIIVILVIDLMLYGAPEIEKIFSSFGL